MFKKQSILKVFSSLYLLHFIFFTLSSSFSSTAMRHKHTPSSN